MIDSETLLNVGVLCTGKLGVTAGQKMKLETLWSWRNHDIYLFVQ